MIAHDAILGEEMEKLYQADVHDRNNVEQSLLDMHSVHIK